MEQIRSVFDRLRRGRGKALIPFIMGGDPDLRTTKELILALADAGADLIEVGVPFSDPLADGPTIQRASTRALAAGTTPPALLETVGQAARRLSVPLVLLSYWNPVVQFGNGARRLRRSDGRATYTGTEALPFLRAARGAGISGLIVPDLPPEEAPAFRGVAVRSGVSPVFLAAPTSSARRLRLIARRSEGFIYYVSLTGTTGARQHLDPELTKKIRQLKLITTKPICVGFGISTPAQAAAVARVADGVIVGSALLNAIEPYKGSRRRVVRQAAKFLARIRRAV